jgi:hypothetical protein
MKDPLFHLLRDADASAPVPRMPAGFADAVRQRRAHQQHRTRMLASGGVVAMLALGFLFQSKRGPMQVSPPPQTPPPMVAISEIDLDAKMHELTAQRLLAAESSRRPRPVVAAIDIIQEQRDRAALVLVYEGDGYARGKRAADAVASYRRAIDLFPGSAWADVARQRIKELNT